MKTFTFINNEKLCAIIQAASQHIIHAAPSVAKSVAQYLCDFAKRNKDVALRVLNSKLAVEGEGRQNGRIGRNLTTH